MVPRSLLRAAQQRVFRRIFKEVVENRDLHIFVLKLYAYGDSFGNETLRRFARLVEDPVLRGKIEKHYREEEKHASLLKRAIAEMGGLPALTSMELRLPLVQGFFAQLDLMHDHGLGISDERLESGRPLEAREIIKVLVFAKREEEQAGLFFPAHLEALQKGTRMREVLEEVVADEEGHLAYITEALDKFRGEGFQTYIDEAEKRCRRLRLQRLPSVGDLFRTTLLLLEMTHFRPVGPGTSILFWGFLWPFLKMFDAVTRRA